MTTTTRAPRPSLAAALTMTVAVATTAASIAFTTWAVADLARIPTEGAAPLAIAITAGLAVEGLWLFLLATEWGQAVRTGRPSKALSVAGWVLALAAAAVIVVHGVITSPVMAILALLPVGAKTAWFFRTRDRAAQTLRERALSTDPTEEEEQALAERERQLEVRRRERELDRQEKEQEHEDEIARIEREGREKLARARVHFTVAREVQQHDREIGYQQTPARIALGSGLLAPDDASSLGNTPPPAGFAAAMGQARTTQAPTVRTSTEGQVRTPAQAPPRGGARVSAEEAAVRRELVWETRDRLIEETGKEPSINALAVATGLHRRTVKRHLEADN